jgi:CDP-diacylglycerol--glycerol-3-phosphate 3-phosphatidyltransferase
MALGGAMQAKGRWATRANALSLLRLVVAPLLAAAVARRSPLAAAALLVVAIVTDLADGAVARRHHEASALGGLLDHAVDATLCTAGLAAWACRGQVPWLLPPLVAAAFTQYVLDSRVLAGRMLRASRLGRWNGIAYYVLVAVPIGRDVLGLSGPGAAWIRAAGWLLVATTLVSMADRLLALRRPQA